MPPIRNVISGQVVDAAKVLRSKELRSEMTPAEAIIWANVRGRKLNGLHFRRQQILKGFIADFYCHAACLIVELDGSIHDQQLEADQERQQILNGWGFDFLRFRNEEVLTDLASVLVQIAQRCDQNIKREA